MSHYFGGCLYRDFEEALTAFCAWFRSYDGYDNAEQLREDLIYSRDSQLMIDEKPIFENALLAIEDDTELLERVNRPARGLHDNGD